MILLIWCTLRASMLRGVAETPCTHLFHTHNVMEVTVFEDSLEMRMIHGEREGSTERR